LLDWGLPAQEAILVTSAPTGTGPYVLPCTRGIDGTTAQAHNAGATAVHGTTSYEPTLIQAQATAIAALESGTAGTVQLAGDLGNTASEPHVIGIQGTAVSAPPGGGSASTNFLRADGSWDIPAGGGTPVANITAYGASTGASDNGPAINDAIASLPSSGGIVLVPPGLFTYSTPIDLASATSVTLMGETVPGAGSSMTSTLTYTGTGSGSAISCQNSNGVAIRNLTLLYSSSSFTGILTDWRNVSGSDTSYGLLENCYLGGGSGITTATQLADLDKCINMTIRKCSFAGAVYGIYGKSVNTNYSNAVHIQDCVFHGQSAFHIYNAGQAWVIDSCTFEALSGGAAGAYAHDTGNYCDTVTFRGCWTGDSTGGTQFTVAGNSVSFTGNWIGAGSGTCIYTDDVLTGLVITGNDYVDCSVALETIQPSGSSACLGWMILGNTYTGVTTHLSGNLAAGTVYHDGNAQGAGTGLTLYGLNVDGAFDLVDGQNIPLGVPTGTKLATATNQKLGFWGTTPIGQPAVSGSSLGAAFDSLLTVLGTGSGTGMGLIDNTAGSPLIAVSDLPTGQMYPSDCGLIAWTFDPRYIYSENALTSLGTGDVWLTKIIVRQAATVSDIVLAVGNSVTSGLTTGENFAGLYNSSGSLVAVTADQTSNWTTSGNANTSLAMSLTVQSGFTLSPLPAGDYWVGLLANGTGGPAVCLGSANSSMVNFGVTASTATAGFKSGAGTSMPASITPSSISTGHGASFNILSGLS
jgi:hypothetical protein